MTPNTDSVAVLRECPFCGSPAEMRGAEVDGFCVVCTSGHGDPCWASVGENYDGDGMPCHMYGSEAEAIAAWNRRHPAPPGSDAVTEEEVCIALAAAHKESPEAGKAVFWSFQERAFMRRGLEAALAARTGKGEA